MQEVCRLCLQTRKNVIPLFRNDINEDECRQLRLQIADLCSIVILQNDDLPKLICWRCKARLQDAYDFVNQCKKSNDKLFKKSEHCQRTPNESIEVAKSTSDDVDESDLHSVIEETPLKERIKFSRNIHCCADNNKKQYLCDICSKTYATMSGLRFHLKSHRDFKPHACQYCGKSFAIPSYMKRHERIHTGDKPFVCHICSTTFASSNGLTYHLRTHTGEADYRCDTCGKSFIRYKYLKEHIFTHTGEKPFVCKLCGSAYGNSGSLFTHEKKCKSRHALDLPRAMKAFA